MIYVLSNFTHAYFQHFINYHHLTENHRKFSHDHSCPIYIPQKYYLNTSYIFFHDIVLQYTMSGPYTKWCMVVPVSQLCTSSALVLFTGNYKVWQWSGLQ